MGVLRIVLSGVLGLAVVLAGLLVAARFSDGPVAVLPGGPLTSGELVADPVLDWSFATDVAEVDLQLLEPPRSRTVWILVEERRAYIPCGFLDVPFWKQWPHEAIADGRAILRIEGKRYEVSLEKVEDPAVYAAVGEVAAKKYGFGEQGASPEPDSSRDQVWYFRVAPRTH